ncbi:MAG: SIMPL domain-containing protein [Firmicutes bacterium]|nr:SIMPL domain-containing protein [Bacillota bacterium]
MKKRCILIVTTLVLSVAMLGAVIVNPQSVMVANATSLQNCIPFGITVTGVGSISVKPDVATISLSVETESKSIEVAQTENSEIAQRLVEVLKGQGISESDITTSWFNIFPLHDYNFGRRVLGYRVSNQLNVRVRDISAVGKVIDLATKAGANIVSGIQFGLEDNSPAYNEALTRAVYSAKQKATLLSKAAGLGELEIVAIKETYFNHFGFARYDAFVCSTTIMHNDIKVSATVEVVFAPTNR